MTAGGASVTTGYDSLGRVVSYTDAGANTTTTSYDIDSRPVSVNDGKGTTTYTYDGANEHRGLITAIDTGITGSPSTFSASYDAGGRLVSQTYPNGLVQTTHYDDADNATQLTYSKGGSTWLTFTQTHSAAGRVRDSSTPASHDDYAYDTAGRLSTVQDTTSSGGTTSCATRAYGYDVNSNRTSLTTYPDDGTQPATGHCTTATTPTTVSHVYNGFDQITDSGSVYDAFGRTTTVPSVDVGGSGPLSLSYFIDGMPNTETQGSRTKTWTLDPAERYHTEADSQTGVTTTSHYSDGSDSPSWLANSDGTWSRNVTGLDSNLALIQNSTGTPQLQLTNLHGDIVATADDATTATGVNGYAETTEFGVARTTTSNPARYGWLGGKRRSSDVLGGLVLMGVRFYNPATGRFLQTDPIPGGSANNYDYCNQDPINERDFDGRKAHPIKKVIGGIPIHCNKKNICVHYSTVRTPLEASEIFFSTLLGSDQDPWKKTDTNTNKVYYADGLLGSGYYTWYRDSKSGGPAIEVRIPGVGGAPETRLKVHLIWAKPTSSTQLCMCQFNWYLPPIFG